MRNIVQFVGVLVTLTIVCHSMEGTLASIRVSETQIREALTRESRNGSSSINPPYLGSVTNRSFLALGQEQRAAVVREAAGIARTILLSPGFQKLHDDYIRVSLKAVNHGLKADVLQPKTAQDAQQVMDDSMRQMAAMLAQQIKAGPVDSAKMMFDMDLQNWTARASRPGSEKVKFQRMVEGAQAIKPLAASNPQEFKDRYAVLKAMEFGVVLDNASIAGETDKAQKLNEQRAWDQYNLRTVTRKKLNEFIALAGTVDFAASTRSQGSRTVFVNPEYERKNSLWKMMFRAGKAPATAAVEAARQTLKEL